jgi:hypothetical protein
MRCKPFGTMRTSTSDDGYLAVESAHDVGVVVMAEVNLQWSTAVSLEFCKIDEPDEGSGSDFMVLYLKLNLRRFKACGDEYCVVTEGHQERVLFVFETSHDVGNQSIHCLMLTNQVHSHDRSIRGCPSSILDPSPTSAKVLVEVGCTVQVRLKVRSHLSGVFNT